MEAYFDNSATTVVTESVKDIVVKAMTEDYGNPSSMHMIGVNAEKYVKTAKENIAKIRDVGVDYVSSGALTHSAPILDISLKNLHPLF